MDDTRLLLTDDTWACIASLLRDVQSPAGAPPELSDRDFVEAILYIARTGIPWRDVPRRFRDWNALYQRLRCWEKAGIGRALFQRLPADLEAVTVLLFDSTVIRAHAHAAGAPAEKAGKPRRHWSAVAAVSAPSCTWPTTNRRRCRSS